MADTLTITDNRTGKQYEIPIELGAIKAMDLRQIRTSPEDFGLMTYDPASPGALCYLDAAREIAARGAGERAQEGKSW